MQVVTTSPCKGNVYTHTHENQTRALQGLTPGCCPDEIWRQISAGQGGAWISLSLLITSTAPTASALFACIAGSCQGSLGNRVVKMLAAVQQGSETLQLMVCWLSNIRRTRWSLIELQLESNKHFQQHLQGKIRSYLVGAERTAGSVPALAAR